MIDKYKKLTIKRSHSGREVYSHSLPSSVSPDISDIVIVVNEMTRLDLLAAKYLGSPSLWWAIAQVNGIVNGTLHVTPGSEIVIPISMLSE